MDDIQKDLNKSVVEVTVREKKILDEVAKINERYATALNLKDKEEIDRIIEESAVIDKKMRFHIGHKLMIMTIATSRNRNFASN